VDIALFFWNVMYPIMPTPETWSAGLYSEIFLYKDLLEIRPASQEQLSDADVGIIASCSPDAIPETELAIQSKTLLGVFYDLDTPVTHSRCSAREKIDSIGPRGLQDFDLVLSFTEGATPQMLKTSLGARKVATLFNHVDPQTHGVTNRRDGYVSNLSYLGTFSADRQARLNTLLIQPARDPPNRKFMVAGSLP
jgi:spore maturation protein CgeB